MADINRSIAQERERIRQTVQSRAAVTKGNEERLTKTLNELTARLGRSDGDLARSQALERDAAADRELYTSFINRARQTDPAVNYQSVNARVLTWVICSWVIVLSLPRSRCTRRPRTRRCCCRRR